MSKRKLLKGKSANGRKYMVHLYGYNFLPFPTGQVDKAPRHEIFYFSDDGDLTALRYDDWKLIFMEQLTDPGGALQGCGLSDKYGPLRGPFFLVG